MTRHERNNEEEKVASIRWCDFSEDEGDKEFGCDIPEDVYREVKELVESPYQDGKNVRGEIEARRSRVLQLIRDACNGEEPNCTGQNDS